MKSGIVGCGGIAEVHANALSKSGQAELIAFADIRPERAVDFAGRYGGRAYPSLEEMLEAEALDVLHICTPHHLHTPMAKLAVSKGIAVFSEKPPVISMEQWHAFSGLAEQGRVGVCFQNRYNQSVCYLKELLASGKPGKLLGARAFVTWSRDAAYYTESGWRGMLETEGGGVLINQSVHTMDLLVQFLGTPVAVDATMTNHHLKGVIEVEDTLEAHIAFSDCNAVFYATNAYCTNAPVLVELCCEEVTIRMEEQEVTCYWNDGKREHRCFDTAPDIGKACWGTSHQLCIEDFYTCLKENRRFYNDIQGVRDSVLLLLAAYRSARENCPVTLDEGGTNQ